MSSLLCVAVTKQLRDVALDVDVALGPGVTTLAGPSGAGKTTLLRLIAGLERPDTGSVRLGDALLDDAGRGYRLPPGRRDVGVVFQEYALFPHLSVAENVAYGLRARRVHGRERRRRVEAMLDRLGVAVLAGERPGRLSGGQRQRVALARALVLEPRALLLDEPLAALDARTRASVRGELRDLLADLPIPTLLVTHDYADALVFRERIIILDAGRVVQDGAHEELLAHPRSRFVADFTGVNYHEGRIETAGDAHGLLSIRLHGDPGVVLYAPADGAPEGLVGVAIHPWDVVLSRQAPAGSARNVLAGRVREVLPLGGRVRVALTIGPRQALTLVSEVTPDAVSALDCRDGETLYASFKATAISIST